MLQIVIATYHIGYDIGDKVDTISGVRINELLAIRGNKNLSSWWGPKEEVFNTEY